MTSTGDPMTPETINGNADSAVKIVRKFLLLMEGRDFDTARTLMAPGFTMTFPGTGPMTSVEELLAWAKPRYGFVKKTYACTDGVANKDDTVTVLCRGTLSGEWLDGTPFDGIRFIDRFELVCGKITKQDVWNDMAEVKATL